MQHQIALAGYFRIAICEKQTLMMLQFAQGMQR
jgi:hypothetical protein